MTTDDAGALQAALLPTVPERAGPVQASVAYRPAEGPAAGGDFYDAFVLEDGRLAVIVGDVSGHGPSALPQTALLRYTLRTFLDGGLQPRAALAAGGAALDHQLAGCFATVVLAVLDPRERTLTYACAGHPPPLVLAPRPLDRVVAAASPPIGAGLATGLRQTVIWLPTPALVCLFTDGLVDARIEGELFGSRRLARALGTLGPDAGAAELLEHVLASTQSRADDMAACVLRLDPDRTGGGHAVATVLCEELEVDRSELAGGRPARFLASCKLTPARARDALRAASVVAACTGAAVVRVTRARQLAPDGPASADVEVSPRTVKVLNLGALPGAERASALRTVPRPRTPAPELAR